MGDTQRLILEPLSQQVELSACELIRQFKVEEMTIDRSGDFLRLLEELRRRESAQVGGDLGRAWEAMQVSLQPVIEMIIRNPQDSLGPPSPEWIDALTLSQKGDLVELQCRLNAYEELMPEILKISIVLHGSRAIQGELALLAPGQAGREVVSDAV